MASLITRKLSSLSGVIADLREQLRAAVATEVGKAVAATVREILEVLIARRPLPKWEKPRGEYYGAPGEFDAWDDPCHTPPSHRYRHDDDDDEFREPIPARPETLSGLPAVPLASLALAVNAGHWIWRLSRSWLGGVGGATGIALAAGFGGPVVRSVIAIAASVHQLAGFGDGPPPPSD